MLFRSQAADTNSGPIYLGGSGVTTSNYGYKLTAGSSVPVGMFDLSALYAVGTANDKLHILEAF